MGIHSLTLIISCSQLKNSQNNLLDLTPAVTVPAVRAAVETELGSYVVSQDIYWFETIYGKCLHKRTNQRSNHYMRRGGHR